MKTDIENHKDVEQLVHSFYDKVQQDDRLNYIFNDFAKVHWVSHLPKMVDFWSNLLFQTGRYKGHPFRQHVSLPIEYGDFERWVLLFEQTVNELFEGKKAELAKELAGKIASSFSIRLFSEKN